MSWTKVALTPCSDKIATGNSTAYLCVQGNIVRAYVTDYSTENLGSNDHYVIPSEYRPKINTALAAIIRRNDGIETTTFAVARASGYIGQENTTNCYGMMAVGEWSIE